MATRREIVCGGALTILWNLFPCMALARDRNTFGCVLADKEAPAFLASATDHQLVGGTRIIPKSGNSEFDYALAQTLARISDALGVIPTFSYFDDFDGQNAYASSIKVAPTSDGSVLFGKRLFIRVMSQPEHPDVGVTAICAHEFGHILQIKRGLTAKILLGEPTVKRNELHADFLAGYYAGTRKLQKSDYPAAVFATQQESFGDHQVDHPQHHGRPDERAAAIIRGFEVAYRERQTLADAIQIGMNFVSGF